MSAELFVASHIRVAAEDLEGHSLSPNWVTETPLTYVHKQRRS